MFRLVVDIHLTDIACLYCKKLQRHALCRILKMSIHRESTIVTFESWVIYFPIGCSHPFIQYWQPLLAQTTATCSLLHPENEHQRRVNSFSCCMFCNRGIALISAFIPELLTAVIDKNTIYRRYNTDSKLIDIASSTACKSISLVVENAILIRYYSHTPKARALIESMDGPAGRPADDPPNSDGLGVYHRTVPELSVQVHCQPGLPIWQRFGLDLDPNPKWQSRTVANTRYWFFHQLIEHPDGRGEEFRDQLLHETCHRQRRQWSQPQAATIRSGPWEKPNTIEILSRISFLQVNSVQSSGREATMDEMRCWQSRQVSWVKDSTLSTRENDYHSHQSIEPDHQSENLQSMASSYPWIGNTENRRQSQETISSRHMVYTYNRSNLEEARRTAKPSKEIGFIPAIPIPGIQNRSGPMIPFQAPVPTYHQLRGFQRKSTKADRQTGNTLAVAVETTKPTFGLIIHGNMQRVKA